MRLSCNFSWIEGVALFRCNWFYVYNEIKVVRNSEYDIVSVNPCIFQKQMSHLF